MGAVDPMSRSLCAADFPPIEKLPVVKELPDPLKMFDGTTVTTVEQWNTHRKPELKALFEHYMYGPMPKPGVFCSAPALLTTFI